MRRSLQFLQDNYPKFRPKIGVILDRNLDHLNAMFESRVEIPYVKLFGFPGGGGKVILGRIQDLDILVFSKNFCLFEGYNPKDIAFPVYFFKEMGCETMVYLNTFRTLTRDLSAGDLVVVGDHLQLLPVNSLFGKIGTEQIRHVDMKDCYQPELRERLLAAASTGKHKVKEAILLNTTGPCFETYAEIKAYAKLGADVVAFGGIIETIAARSFGLKVLSMGVVVSDYQTPVDTLAITATVDEETAVISQLFKEFILQS